MKTTKLNRTTAGTIIFGGLALSAALAVPIWAAEPAAPALAPNQPHLREMYKLAKAAVTWRRQPTMSRRTRSLRMSPRCWRFLMRNKQTVTGSTHNDECTSTVS